MGSRPSRKSLKLFFPGSLQSLTGCVAVLLAATSASGFFNNDRWQLTATDFLTGPAGTSVTITWGIAEDGTAIPNVFPGVNRNSDFVSAFDGLYGGGEGLEDLTNRPWFSFIRSSFQRWDELSGIDFVFESADDGAQHGSSTGILGTRADLRLAGTLIDGTVGTNTGTVGYTIAPENGDIVLDTADAGYYGDAAGNAFGLRHTLMHEIGHSIGLGHVVSPNSNILMEPFTQTTFDGPQIDDIRGVHFLYGDQFEKGAGNDSFETATLLGELTIGDSLLLGADAGFDTGVAINETDFVSISNSNDEDFFSFSVDTNGVADIVLTPAGPTYVQRIESGPFTTIDTSSIGDLQLELYQANNSLLMLTSDTAAAGAGESLLGVELSPGEYAIRVAGTTTETQLYQLELNLTAPDLAGDFNSDGSVDAADYTIWRDTLDSTELLAADADNSGVVDGPDYAIWAASFGEGSTPNPVPEPAGWILITTLWILICFAQRVPFCLMILNRIPA